MTTEERHKLINILERTNPIAVLEKELENGDLKYKARLSRGQLFFFIVPKEKSFVGKLKEKMLDQELSKNLIRHLVSKKEYYEK